MLTDRYELPLSTASSAARDAYVEGCAAMLTTYPGAIERFDRAIAADPGFALAHAARAHVLLERGSLADQAQLFVKSRDSLYFPRNWESAEGWHCPIYQEFWKRRPLVARSIQVTVVSSISAQRPTRQPECPRGLDAARSASGAHPPGGPH